MLLGTMMRVWILGLGLIGWFLHGTALITTAMVFLFLYGLFSGPQGVAFQFLLGKMIPIAWRGRLQGWRNLAGGLIAAGLSYLAGKYLIGANLWGNGYGAMYLAAFVLTSAGLTAFRLIVREPEPPSLRPRVEFRERVRDFVPMLRDNPPFLYFMIARTFAIANRVAAPFYVIYAGKALGGLSGTTIALLSFAYIVADPIANLVWGPMADRLGFPLLLHRGAAVLDRRDRAADRRAHAAALHRGIRRPGRGQFPAIR